MTTEHKILALLDRGIVSRHDLRAILGPEANSKALQLLDDGLLQWPRGASLSLTDRGVERLDVLDEISKKL